MKALEAMIRHIQDSNMVTSKHGVGAIRSTKVLGLLLLYYELCVTNN
jgi:hypothetical protein